MSTPSIVIPDLSSLTRAELETRVMKAEIRCRQWKSLYEKAWNALGDARTDDEVIATIGATAAATTVVDNTM